MNSFQVLELGSINITLAILLKKTLHIIKLLPQLLPIKLQQVMVHRRLLPIDSQLIKVCTNLL